MKITKKEYLNSIFWLLLFVIFLAILDYLFNKKISLSKLMYVIIPIILVVLSFQIGNKYYEKRFKTMKIETIRKKYPLYFLNEKSGYRGFMMSGVKTVGVIMLFILYYLFLQDLLVWSGLSKAFLVSLPIIILLAYFTALAFYYLYKSKKINQKILITLMSVYFLIIPAIIITRFSILFKPALIFIAISMIILMLYDIYIMTMYLMPVRIAIAIALKKAKQKQQALKSEKALSRHGKGREKSRKGSYSM